MFRKLVSAATMAFVLGLSPVYSEEISVTTSYVQSVGDQLYALTDGYYSYDDLEGIENYLKEEGENFHVASYDEIDASKLKELFTFDYILLKEGPVSVYTGQLCNYAGVGKAWECNGKIIPMNKKFKVLLIGKNSNENLNVDLPFCRKRCYDARALIYNAPINWNYQDGEEQFNLKIKKGLILVGLIRPYGNGCLIQGCVSLCVNSGTMILSFRYPDGRTYSVSAPVQMKYWNSFRATINPNMIGLLVRQHGTDEVVFNYKDLGYAPVDDDKIGYVYDAKVTFKRISNDPYEWAEITILSGQAKQPFCGEQIAYCNYNYLAVHSWKENNKIYYGVVLARNIDRVQKSFSLYRREGVYETIFNTGDLYVGNEEAKAGIIGYWKGTDNSFGVYQEDYKNDLAEIYGYEVDYKTLTPHRVGFLREKGDYPDYYYGFESNRKEDWIASKIPYPALWTDKGLYYSLGEGSKACVDWNLGAFLKNGRCYYIPDCGKGFLNPTTDKCEINLANSCGIPNAFYENGTCFVAPTNDCPEGGKYDPATDKCIAEANVTCPEVEGQSVVKTGGTCIIEKLTQEKLLKRINVTPNSGTCNENGGTFDVAGTDFYCFEPVDSYGTRCNYVPKGKHKYIKTLRFTLRKEAFISISGPDHITVCEKNYHPDASFSRSSIEYKLPNSDKWKLFIWGKYPAGTKFRLVYYVSCNHGRCNVFGSSGYIDINELTFYCPDGWKELDAWRCETSPTSISCPKGYSYNEKTKRCEAEPDRGCPAGYVYDPSKKVCKKNISVSCPPGFVLDGGKCVKDPSCPSGASYNSSRNLCVGHPSYVLPKLPEDIKLTDDGIFQEYSDLCPAGQVELYRRDGKDFEGRCFTYKEPADCYLGSVNGLDEDRFGNYCYIEQPKPPYICPSDGRSYTVLRPPSADFICETTTTPKCDAGDYRRGGACYYQVSPKCPLPNGVLSGSACTGYVSPSCPFGSLDTSRDICVSTASASCPAGYSDAGTYCRSTYAATYVHKICTYHYQCHPHSCNCHKECSEYYDWSLGKWVTRCKTVCSTCYDTCWSTYDCSYYYCPYGGNLSGTTCVKTASKICPYGYHYVSNKDICEKTAYPICPFGYSYDGSANMCKRTINSCSYEAIGLEGYSYDSATGVCLKYKEDACNANNPYSDWKYDASRDLCYHRTPAQCPSPQERKVDPDTGWSACYLLETQTVSYYPSASEAVPGRIYCRNGYYYWEDRCYKLEGTACKGNYFTFRNAHKLVIIGKGNSYDEWTGKCWKKIKDSCDKDSYPLRGEFSTDIHCLHKEKSLSESFLNPEVQKFSSALCNYLAEVNFGASCNTWFSPQKRDAYSSGILKYDARCPLDSNSACIDVGGEMQLCGTNKVCIGCGEFAQLNHYPAYSVFKYIHYEGDRAYGISWYEVPPTYLGQIIKNARGRLPTQSELQKFSQYFGNDSVWYQEDPDLSNPNVKKYIGIVWDDFRNAGFLGMCVVDDNGDGLCTADMVECFTDSKGNLQCPYNVSAGGSKIYPCQPYKGKYYCSKYSSACRNAADTSFAMQNLDTSQGANDKHNDGEVAESGCLGTVYIFNGRDLRCRPPGFQTGFSNCCKKTKTWFGLGYCKESEKQLAALRSWGKLDGQCHYVGSYCAVKVFGVCLQKKKTYCCFNSVLARIVQEQGRQQLGIDWGSPKFPNCRGFTPEEFQRIDFSKIDFSEWYEDLQKRIKENLDVFKSEMPEKIQNYYKNLQKY